jgi:hypothetical protein
MILTLGHLAGIALTLAAILGPAVNVACFLAFPTGIDPLYPGLAASLARKKAAA